MIVPHHVVHAMRAMIQHRPSSVFGICVAGPADWVFVNAEAHIVPPGSTLVAIAYHTDAGDVMFVEAEDAFLRLPWMGQYPIRRVQ